MTWGGVRSDVRALTKTVKELEDIVAKIQGGELPILDDRRSGGSAFTDEQTRQIDARIEARAALFRLVLLSLGSIATLAASLVFAYLKFRT